MSPTQQSMWGQQFMWGCFGAGAVEIIHLHKVATAAETSVPSFSLFYIVVVLGLVVIGGLWSVALESHTKFLAFYHGATAPIVISALVG